MHIFISIHMLSFTVPVFGFAPLSYLEVEGNRSAQVTIVEVNNLQFGNGVSRTLTINSRTTGQGIPAIGKPWRKSPPTRKFPGRFHECKLETL